jgi:hypothetical protein
MREHADRWETSLTKSLGHISVAVFYDVDIFEAANRPIGDVMRL